jgi:hypothetical protein
VIDHDATLVRSRRELAVRDTDVGPAPPLVVATWWAACSCGWVGAETARHARAVDDLLGHIGRPEGAR